MALSFRHPRHAERPTGLVGDHADKLSRVPPIPHDPDERPSREDLQPARTVFDIPVPVPKFLRPRRERRNR